MDTVNVFIILYILIEVYLKIDLNSMTHCV